ncbi:ferric enterobactin uptake receptor, partial [Helicobacter marmotae]
MKSLQLSVSAALSLALTFAFGEPLSPQERESLDFNGGGDNVRSVNLGRSVVSATGYEQDIKDAPASIAIIPQEEILTRPIRDLGDAVQDVPGVYVEATKTGGNTISMRGLGSAYTLILIDGKRQNVARGFNLNGFDGQDTSFMPPASMIDRIEVIRGPASIIYGSDAMGGVINIITKKNPDTFTSGIQLHTDLMEENVFGHQYGFNAYVAGPIIQNTLSFNIRGGYKWGEQNDFRKPAGLVAATTGGGGGGGSG